MNTYSLRSSLEERARKKNPTLDIVAPKKILPRPTLVVSSSPVSVIPISISREITHVERPRPAQWERLLFVVRQKVMTYSGVLSLWLKKSSQFFVPKFVQHKMLYASLMGGVAFGMVSMAFIEHAFGPGVFARGGEESFQIETEATTQTVTTPAESLPEYVPDQDIFFEYFGQVTKEKYEESVRNMVKGYPVEAMLPYILEQDRLTAAFLIGIAKKESNWGKRVPVLEDQDCFNYWGYRGVRRMMGTGGHTCFNSREDAVETVAKRLEKLIHSEKLDTPEKMIIWKCGFSCQGHSRESVKKWISDVDMYFSQLNDE